MVYAENEKSLADGRFYFSCKHSMQMGNRSPFFSPVNNLEAMTIDTDQCTSGEEQNCQIQFEGSCAFGSPVDANQRDPRGTGDPSSSGYVSANSDNKPCCLSDMGINIGKRHDCSDDLCALEIKRARLDSCSSGAISQLRDREADRSTGQLSGREAQVSSTEPVSKTSICNSLDARDASGIGASAVSNISSDVTGISLDKSNDIGFVLSELPAEPPSQPRFVERNELSNRKILAEGGMSSSFYDNYFRKPILMGPNHQVDVPPMDSINLVTYDAIGSNKFVGTCIIPMPDVDTSSSSGIKLRNDVSDCCCSDHGSIRCVRQHVTEARESAKTTFGPEKFSQLGFCDMGEGVADRWTVEEEQLFHKVVFANPASIGKNFWNVLPRFFTTRNSKELVSYYFNVFMLRKRAEQNRFDPRNADSDNDEWTDGDDGHYTMDGAGECLFQSPTYRGNAYVTRHEEDHHSTSDDDDKETCDDCDVASAITEQGLFNLSSRCIDGYNEEDDSDNESCENFATGSESYVSEDLNLPQQSMITYNSDFIQSEMAIKRNSEGMGDNNACDNLFEGYHRGVCSSGDHNPVCAAAEDSDLSLCKNVQECKTNLNTSTEHGYLSSPCDSKTWDVGFFAGSGKVVEFLPTCYVIEEVFGKGNTDDDTKDGPSIV